MREPAMVMSEQQGPRAGDGTKNFTNFCISNSLPDAYHTLSGFPRESFLAFWFGPRKFFLAAKQRGSGGSANAHVYCCLPAWST